jgi:hypothetical protein
MNGIFVEVQLPREFTDRPKRRTVFRFAASSQDPCLEFGRNHGGLTQAARVV